MNNKLKFKNKEEFQAYINQAIEQKQRLKWKLQKREYRQRKKQQQKEQSN